MFYQGAKPNLFPFELPADTLEEAASLSRTKFFWFINGQNNYKEFDFSYRAVPWEETFVHVWPSQWQQNGSTYFANKYTVDSKQWHFKNINPVNRLASTANWCIPDNIDATTVDYSWHPNPLDPPYIYHFPSHYQSSSGVTYTATGATEIKLIDAFVVIALPNKTNWIIPDNIDATTVDYSWHPNPLDPPYIYHFPSQHQSSSGVTYIVPGATEIKLIDAFVVTTLPDRKNWSIPDNINADTVDYTWHPNPLDPPFIYHFPVKWGWSNVGGVAYCVPGAAEHKYIDIVIAETKSNREYWYIPDHIDPDSIDYTWCPNPADPPMIYQFPVKWGWDRIGGPEYRVPGATDVKFVDDFSARTLSDMSMWRVPANIDTESFDFSWVPHPAEEPYIYKFPTVWNAVGGPEYRVPGATKEKYIDVLVARTLPDRALWTIPEEVNADTVDFSWVPHPQDPPYIYHFGTEFQSSIGLTYTMPGATEVKFAGPIPELGQHDNPVLQVLDIFFIDKSNISSAARYEKLVDQYPHAQRVRYVNSMIDTIRRCIARAKTSKFWVISSENIYDNFNFEWHAEPWQSYMTHVFGSQHQKWSDTYLINRWEFERTVTWANSLEEFPNLNFVQDQSIVIPDDLHDIYFVDHGNENDQFEQLQKKHANIKTTRYVDNYLDTFKRIMSTATTEHVWIISSLCDYTRFDFSWQPEPWQKEMIHVFPSNNQERGDTFYIHVESFKLQMVELELLDWFNVINYCKEQRVPRLPIPSQQYTGDNLIETIKSHEFKHPFTWFSNYDRSIQYNPSIWYAKDRKIVGFSAGNSYVLVPRDAKSVINTQAYDYPYITKMPMFDEHALDIIYISNGEPDAERWYEHLISTIDPTRRSVRRVQNVDGRANAYKAAAEVSRTPWFFAVFAKLEVVEDFDWDWQPDYLQGPKHYIFHAKNPVNGLEYGHMGVIAYNKRLVQETTDTGLDFTLSKAHAVVPVLSAVAHYNTTPELTWRTAFRECIKLKDDAEKTGSIESNYRLVIWLNQAEGLHAESSLQGARDALEYYNEVDGDYEKLMLTFEWSWLKQYYATKYTL